MFVAAGATHGVSRPRSPSAVAPLPTAWGSWAAAEAPAMGTAPAQEAVPVGEDRYDVFAASFLVVGLTMAAELVGLDEDEFCSLTADVQVFARVSPEQKVQ